MRHAGAVAAQEPSATARRHAETPPAPTEAPGATGGDVPELAERLARHIHQAAANLDLGSDWALYAAFRILAEDDVREGLHAREFVARLDVEHQPRMWADDSDAQSCTCGTAGCRIRDALDGTRT